MKNKLGAPKLEAHAKKALMKKLRLLVDMAKPNK
jgi:hypothetical protein